ncbi:MAG: outer membrane beta-barrel protein [Bacteroidales bacterium]|nr:outer membrane beta-barrel protein [Bacteroidales bacterium]
MFYRFKIPILVLLVILIFNNHSVAQDDCLKTLENAGKLYDQGIIDDIPELLAPCMESGFTRAQKTEAYKLIIMAYLFNDEQFEAENNMVEFLKKYPEYEIMPNDPVEFVYLFESYRTMSVFSINFTLGPNFTNPRIIEPYTLGDVNYTTLENSSGIGFLLGLGLSRDIGKNLKINVDVYYGTNQYKFTEQSDYQLYEEKVTNIVTFKEKINQFQIPLTFLYDFGTGNTGYFFRGGMGIGIVNKASGTPERVYGENIPKITGADIDITNQRNKINYFVTLGGGIKYKVPRGFLACDARLNIGLNNVVNTENRFDNAELWSKYLYLDDDFAINSVSIVFGYYFSFYQPKKRR